MKLRKSLRMGLAAGTVALGTSLVIPGLVANARQTTTIVYLNHFTSGPSSKYDREVAQEFEKSHPGVKVQLDEVQDSDTSTKFQTMVASGQPPSVYDMGQTEFQQALDAGILSPVDYSAFGVNGYDEFARQYIPGALAAYRSGDTLYGVPEEMSNYLAFVNTKYFREAGIKNLPKSWHDVFVDARKLTKRNSAGQIVREEIALPMNFPVAEYLVVDAIARDFGNGLFNADGTKSNLTSPAVVKAFETLQALVYRYHAFYPALNGTTSASERDLFGQGKAAMILDAGVWFQSTLQQQYPNVWKYTQPIPYPTQSGRPGKSELYGYAWVVPKNASNQQLCWEFVHFLQQHALGYYKNAGVMSGVKTLANSKELAQTKYWKAVWLPSYQRGVYETSLKNNSQILDILDQAYAKILLKNAPVKPTLEDANQQIIPLLNRS
ncbi:MAG: extracellular solute-binding protein [Alicyclobacillus sp.]|nr:extracellular solute-binding protein [Alicyclobacillus sp.]